MDTPRFTVVTPSFNQGAFIEKTIDSVLSQGHPNLEYIIIDGGSTDDTVEIVKKYERHLAYWVSEKDRGQSHAINKGMARATGSYLTWLNSDDWCLPGTMKTMSEMLGSNREAGVVVGAGRIVDARGNQVYFKEPNNEITVESLYRWLTGGDFMQPSCAFTRESWERAGGLDEGVHIALDVDLWIRMAKAGVKFVTTPRIFSEALSHPSAKTTAYEDLMRLDCSIVVIRHGGERYVRSMLETMCNDSTRYRHAYSALVNNPLVRLLWPIIRRTSVTNSIDPPKIPPWKK